MRSECVRYLRILCRWRALDTLDYILEQAREIHANVRNLPDPLPAAFQYTDDNEHTCVLVDTEGRIIYANAVACRLLGSDIHRLRGRCVFAIVPRWRSEPRKQILDAVVKSGNAYQYLDCDGNGNSYDARFIPIKQQGEVVQVVYLGMQLTETPEPFRMRVIE